MTTVTLVDVETRTGWRHFTDAAMAIIDRQPYQPRLESTGGYTRHQFEPGSTLGRGGAEADPILLTNADRALDGLHRAVDGRRVIVRRAPLAADGSAPRALSAYSIVFQGRSEGVVLQGDVCELRILSRQSAIAEAPVATERFDGTATSGGAGVGGGADLAGKPRPILVGYAYNFTPPPANAYDDVYQISAGWTGHTVAIESVRDRGAALSAGTGHATLADLLTATPTAGTYDRYSGADGTFIKLAATPAGTVTVSATEGGGRTVAEVAEWLLLRSPDVTVVSGVAAMNGLVTGEAGIWIGPDDRAIGTALEEALNGVGWWADALDDLTVNVGAWVAPAGAVQTIDEWETLEPIDLLSTADVGGGAAVSEVLVGYRRNYTPLNKSELEDTVATEDAAPLSEEYRLAPVTVDGALDRNPLAQAMRVDTALKDLAAAEAIATRHAALRGTGIDLYRATLPTSRVTADIGQGVTITNSRHGLSAGALCGVLGRDTAGRTLDGIPVTDLTLWRPSP